MPDYHAENTNVEQRLKLEDKINELKKERADRQMGYYGIRSPRFTALATRWDKLRAKLKMVRKRQKWRRNTRLLTLKIWLLQLYHLYLVVKP